MCIALALANKPDIILMDEPASAPDPISTGRIETTIDAPKSGCTNVIVSHNRQQTAPVSGYTAFMMLGELVEFEDTRMIYTNPGQDLTGDYITGRFG